MLAKRPHCTYDLMPLTGQRGGHMTADKASDTGDQYCRHPPDLGRSSSTGVVGKNGNSLNTGSVFFFTFMPNPVYNL
jgi:hypothetical protein